MAPQNQWTPVLNPDRIKNNTMLGRKILVADDSLTIQKVIRLALSGDGYEIQTVSDGREATEQASLFRPDICIIDVSLPIKDAYQIREEFLQTPDLRSIPIIMMSSAFEKVDEPRMKQLGFAGHLIKPFDPSHLRSTLQSVVQSAAKQDVIEESIAISPKTESRPLPTTIRLKSTESGIKIENPALEIVAANFDLTPEPSLQDDIQQLTHSTYQEAGLDQQEWGVVEPLALEKAPPQSQMPEKDLFLDSSMFPAMQAQPEAEPVFERPTSASNQNNLSFDSAMIQAEVLRQVEALFQKEVRNFLQQKLATSAEKIIRDEIHRILNDPPN